MPVIYVIVLLLVAYIYYYMIHHGVNKHGCYFVIYVGFSQNNLEFTIFNTLFIFDYSTLSDRHMKVDTFQIL